MHRETCRVCEKFRADRLSTPIAKSRYRTEGRRRGASRERIDALNRQLNALSFGDTTALAKLGDAGTIADSLPVDEGARYIRPIDPTDATLLLRYGQRSARFLPIAPAAGDHQ